MTNLPIYSGPSKRDMIQQAYAMCGQAGYEFDIEAEEYAAATSMLDRMMWQLLAKGCDLGYSFPEQDVPSNPSDESGIDFRWEEGVVAGLTLRLAPTLGKTLAPETRSVLSDAWKTMLAENVVIPQMQMGRHSIRGAGNRLSYFGPFFVTGTLDNEIVQ